MSQVLLVRHGQASWGAPDYDVLSDVGHEQARVLGRAFAERGIAPTVVVRGRMRRHCETAEATGAAAGWDVPVTEDHGWDEFDHEQMLRLHPTGVGEGEELTRAAFQQWFEEATLRWTSGAHAEEYDESFAHFGSRVEDALRRTVDRLDRSDTAVVFTSGGPVSWVATALLGGDPGLWTQLNPVTVNASVTKVVVGRRGTTLVSFNEHSHLEVRPGLVTYR
jgi:broad specificity phosphatase PhoE